MTHETVLQDAHKWQELQAAIGRMITQRGGQAAGTRLDPRATGLLRAAFRRGIASSEYLKLLAQPALRAELIQQLG